MTKKYIKEKWKEVCSAKEEAKNAEAEIITVNVIRQPNVCITNVIVAGNNNSNMYPDVCENFEQNKICENVNCPMYRKNMRYILTHQKYKQLRKDFFKMLFRGCEKQK